MGCWSADNAFDPWMQDLGRPVIFDALTAYRCQALGGRPQRRRPAHGAVLGSGGDGGGLQRPLLGDASAAGRGAERRTERGRAGSTAALVECCLRLRGALEVTKTNLDRKTT